MIAGAFCTLQAACLAFVLSQSRSPQQPVERAPIRAITLDGREVLLSANNTWSYAPEEGADALQFRNAKWGMSLESVLATEKTAPLQNADGVVTYKDRLINRDVYAAFIFAGEVLVRGKYVLVTKHMNPTDFYTVDYAAFLNALKDKYGKPNEEETTWKNDLYKDDPSEWGTAISVGHMVSYTKWLADDTDITLVIYGDNFNVTVAIEYTSKSLETVENKLRADEDKKKL